ncbi:MULTISPECIES: DUF3592 domain-containing protein [unclassified Nocardioides]|uniref:DUF3592 domain-containing protein n=1 Tax=unclassified Nocardioides TaxID=2615069 RepID=UPI0006F491C0|nr:MULTISPECIES: DUF3592 domain-containing protein [unclassified Nocardioides]KQY57366.1 hypothetical protein ASD30_14225 [Nocardioides sp. Root140]KQZ68879.1 hypothetical protein ASD66_16645 [Nocardioides sp. Root151]KRF20444.1 hypothetical protein ASH02_22340 [Nocardioides sp. Soil796]
MGSDDLPEWAGLLISVMLMAPFLIVLLIYLRHQLRRRTWSRAEATVTGRRTEKSRQGDGSETTTTTVTYAFSDANETDRTGTAVNPSGDPRGGDRLQIMYDPRNPDRSKVVELRRMYLVILAVFFVMFALGVWSVFTSLGTA